MSDPYTLPLAISPADIAAATLANHRRIARKSGANPAVIDSPAYRATLARTIASEHWQNRFGVDRAVAESVARIVGRQS